MSTVAETNVATTAKVVQVRSVSKIFKRDAFEVKALDDVSIDIATGEFMALMGPSYKSPYCKHFHSPPLTGAAFARITPLPRSRAKSRLR